jgi:hypothetical protein
MRLTRISCFVAAVALTAACGPTVLVDGALSGDATSGAGADGSGAAAPTGGSGASGSGAADPTGGSGASGSGASAPTGGSGAGNGGGTKKEWAKAFGAGGHQHLRALASDNLGNVIAAGSFDGVLDPGTGPLDQTGLRSAFVLKLTPKGKVLWSQTFTADDCAAEAIAIGSANEVLVTGSVKGSLHVGGAPMASSDGIFVVKLDGDGAPIWVKTYGTSAGKQADRGLSIAALPDGGAVVGGSFAGSLTIGMPVPADHGVFVAALSSTGDGAWAMAIDGTTGVVAAGADGRVLAATNTDGGGMGVNAFGPGGTPGWGHKYAPGTINALALDAAGNALLVGSTTTADFGGGPLPSPLPNGEGFLVSLDPNGKHRYTRGLPFDTTQSNAVALTVDSAGHVAVTGSYVHKVDASTVIQSAFLATFDQAGAPLASHTFGPSDGFGGAVTQAGWGLAPAPAGGLYFGGDFFTQIDVAGKSLQGDGTADVFVARLTP